MLQSTETNHKSLHVPNAAHSQRGQPEGTLQEPSLLTCWPGSNHVNSLWKFSVARKCTFLFSEPKQGQQILNCWKKINSGTYITSWCSTKNKNTTIIGAGTTIPQHLCSTGTGQVFFLTLVPQHLWQWKDGRLHWRRCGRGPGRLWLALDSLWQDRPKKQHC